MNNIRIHWKSEELTLIYKSVREFILKNGRHPYAISAQDKADVESVLPENRRKNPISRDAFNCIMSNYRKLLDANGELKLEVRPPVEKPELLVVSQEIMVEMSHMFDEKLKPVIAAIQDLNVRQEKKIPDRKEVKFTIRDNPVPDQRYINAIAIRPPAVCPNKESHQYSPMSDASLVPVTVEDETSVKLFVEELGKVISNDFKPTKETKHVFQNLSEERVRAIFKEEFEKIFGSKEQEPLSHDSVVDNVTETKPEIEHKPKEGPKETIYPVTYHRSVTTPSHFAVNDKQTQEKIYSLVKEQMGVDVIKDDVKKSLKKVFVFGITGPQIRNLNKAFAGVSNIVGNSTFNESVKATVRNCDFVVVSKFSSHSTLETIEQIRGKDKVTFASGGISMIKKIIRNYLKEEQLLEV